MPELTAEWKISCVGLCTTWNLKSFKYFVIQTTLLYEIFMLCWNFFFFWLASLCDTLFKIWVVLIFSSIWVVITCGKLAMFSSQNWVDIMFFIKLTGCMIFLFDPHNSKPGFWMSVTANGNLYKATLWLQIWLQFALIFYFLMMGHLGEGNNIFLYWNLLFIPSSLILTYPKNHKIKCFQFPSKFFLFFPFFLTSLHFPEKNSVSDLSTVVWDPSRSATWTNKTKHQSLRGKN